MKSEQNSTEFPQISNTEPPENVLNQFVASLSEPIRVIEEALPSLPEIKGQNNEKATISQLGQAVLMMNQNTESVLEYLNSTPTNNRSVAGITAQIILSVFTHKLREQAVILSGYVGVMELAIGAQRQLPEDRLEQLINHIEKLGKIL